MKKIVIAILSATCISFYATAQCPTNAGPNHTVCSNVENSAYPVTIGPSEPYPGAWSGLSFSWSPTTGLSNPNICNPDALPNTTTTYTLTVSGGGCGTHNYTTTVRVAGIMYVTNPNGTKTRVRSYYDIYYPYEGSYSVQFSTDDPNATWGLSEAYGSIDTYPAGTGLTYNLNFTGLGNNWYAPYLISYDDNQIGCSYHDYPQIVTHGVYSNGYPVTVTSNYYTYSSCGPTLPATISQVSSICSATPTYQWTLVGSNSSNWSITSPSGNSATLNRSGGTPPVSNDIYTRAYTGSSPIGQYTDGCEVWMRWGIGYHSGAYPTCYPMTKKVVDENNKLLVDDGATKLFPNPARSFVTVASKYSINKIEMYNAAGLLVRTMRGNGKASININTVGLSKGGYLLKVNGEKGVESLKVVVE